MLRRPASRSEARLRAPLARLVPSVSTTSWQGRPEKRDAVSLHTFIVVSKRRRLYSVTTCIVRCGSDIWRWWRVCSALEISIQLIGMMLLMGLYDSSPRADINGSLAVAPTGTVCASSAVKPGGAVMLPELPMLVLSHSAHASNGAKTGEPKFATPVSPAFPPKSAISYSSSYTPSAPSTWSKRGEVALVHESTTGP